MNYENGFYLVRHGDYGHDGSLNDAGREVHAPDARDRLIARGLGSSAVLLSSNAPRAAETAEIIGEGLGANPVLSKIINEAGNNAWMISDLDATIEQALQEAGIEIDSASQGLVVVAHAPMLAIAKGVQSHEVGYGEVLTYIRNSWNNPDAPK